MRVLSLSRPWPWVMLHDDPAIVKLIENRTWAPSKEVIGQWIALHAARSWDRDALRYWESVGITGYPTRKDDHESGEIQGVFLVDRICTGSSNNLPAGLPPGQAKWFFGPVGWVGARSIRLKVPVPHVGGQGLRHLPAEKETLIVAQLALQGTPIQ